MQIDSSEKLGKFIKSLRKALGITQKDLALAAGSGLRFIIDLEKGKITCQLGKALKILQILGVKLECIPPVDLKDI